MSTQYDGIYYNQSRASGQMRMSESGLGWKSSATVSGKPQEPVLLPADELVSAQWTRGARGWMLRLSQKSGTVVQFDGFEGSDFERLKNALSNTLDLPLDPREHSTRGWNWGHTEFEKGELTFNIGGRPAVEVPYDQVANANVIGKSEVAVEFALEGASERSQAGDELVELRFYVPGTVGTEEVKEALKVDETELKEEVKEELGVETKDIEYNAADVFCQELKDKVNLGYVKGDELVGVEDILFLTPRGRYDMDLCGDSFRLRGKSYDYKVRYTTIQRIFVLPKSDELHNLVILQLDPPLSQGQTRYPFLVMQFARDEVLQVDLNVEEEEFQQKYADRLEKTYDDPGFRVVSNLLKGLAQRKITFTGSFVSAHNQPCIECSYKAASGSLYILEKAFLFISRAPVYIPFTDVNEVVFSRVGGAVASSRTFDLTINLKNRQGHYSFSSIEREEQYSIETYMSSKTIKVTNDIVAEQKRLEAITEGLDLDDEESDDEDFNDDSDTDDAEEFDSDVSMSDDEPKRPKKKAKKN